MRKRTDMAEVNLSINGRSYPIMCDDGQEGRILQLASHIDERLQEISSSGAASSDNHLLVLTALILADEVFDLRDNSNLTSSDPSNDDAIGETLRSIASRVSLVSQRLKNL